MLSNERKQTYLNTLIVDQVKHKEYRKIKDNLLEYMNDSSVND